MRNGGDPACPDRSGDRDNDEADRALYVPLAPAKRPVPPVIVSVSVALALVRVNVPFPEMAENSLSPLATKVLVPVDERAGAGQGERALVVAGLRSQRRQVTGKVGGLRPRGQVERRIAGARAVKRPTGAVCRRR